MRKTPGSVGQDATSDAGKRLIVYSQGRGKSGYEFDAQMVDALTSSTNEAPPNMDFAQMLRDAIREAGVSQYQLSKQTGIPQGSLSMFLAGGDLRLATFNRLACLMGFELRQNRRKAPRKKTV